MLHTLPGFPGSRRNPNLASKNDSVSKVQSKKLVQLLNQQKKPSRIKQDQQYYQYNYSINNHFISKYQ